MSVDPTPVLDRLAAELGPGPTWSDDDVAHLAAAARDANQLKRWLKRRLAGEPVAHITGRLHFRGLELAIDKRAYVTDPELTHLVDAVIVAASRLATTLKRPPLVAELGVGCGSLALAIKQAVPSTRLVGLDLDPDALALARANARSTGLELQLIESDLFDSWPADLPAPDLIYGDPPWGDDQMLYGDDRPAGHYRAMPPASAFPLGGATGVHEQVLQAVRRRDWSPEIWLNGGVIPRDRLEALGRLAPPYRLIEQQPGISLLVCGQVGHADGQ